MAYQPVKFPPYRQDEFLKTLRGRIDGYFAEKGISQHANAEMVFKTFCLVSLYIVPYILMMSGVISTAWGIFAAFLIMGFAKAFNGMAVMHDANHGAYSANPNVNRWVGYVLNMLGGLVLNWKIQHNRLHHSYTNIDGHDEDIDAGFFLRFSPSQKRHGFHKTQHLYAWIFYGLNTLIWVTIKDFLKLAQYKKKGFITSKDNKYQITLAKIIGLKVFYFTYALVLPLMFLPVANWVIVVSFMAMHYVAGLTLACVFQLAHVMPTSTYPMPNNQGSMENQWAIHQLHTTTNFSPNSPVFSWFLGGLNYQVEHHLFPKVCHVHYRNLAPIVKQTAEEYGVPYNNQGSFLNALYQHAKMLKALGNEELTPEGLTEDGYKKEKVAVPA